MKNVFDKLMNVQPLPGYPNAMLYIYYNDKFAWVVMHAGTTEEVDLSSVMSDKHVHREIMSRIFDRLNLEFDGDHCLLNVFINVRDDIIREITKRAEEQKRREEAINSIENKEMLNIDIYSSFFGYKYIKTYNIRFLTRAFKDFKKVRSQKVRELHALLKLHRYNQNPYRFGSPYDPERMEYNSIMGLDYIYNNSDYINGTYDDLSKTIVWPLAELNPDYTRRKINILNVELAYINRNIKAIKEEIRRLKEGENGNNDGND